MYSEVFELPLVRWTESEGHVLAAFYGDDNY